jgi:hypothetical protein
MRALCCTSCLSNVLPQILNRTLVVPHLIWPRASDIQDQSLEDLTHFGDESCAFCTLSKVYLQWPVFSEHVFDLHGIYKSFPTIKVYLMSSLFITFSLIPFWPRYCVFRLSKEVTQISKIFMHAGLSWCQKSQLKMCCRWFREIVKVTDIKITVTCLPHVSG